MANKEETKLVQFKAPASRVEAWDEYWQNEPELTDRSDLIRKSVERTISTDTDDQQTQDTIERTEALEHFERLESLVEDIGDEIDVVKGDIVNEDEMSDIMLNRSYRATKRVLEKNEILKDDS
jgi:hypothetical protein